jgi:hypothetical protein
MNSLPQAQHRLPLPHYQPLMGTGIYKEKFLNFTN